MGKEGLRSRKEEEDGEEKRQTVGSPSSSSTETQRGSAVCTKYCFAMLKHINTSYTQKDCVRDKALLYKRKERERARKSTFVTRKVKDVR